MSILLAVACLLPSLSEPPSAESPNPIFDLLLRDGVPLTSTTQVCLPEPTMPDGLQAEEQWRCLEQLPERTMPVEELVRPSSVAPFVLRIYDVPAGQPQPPGRGVDLYFLTPGSLDQLVKSDFLERLLNSGRKDARIEPLNLEQLKRNGGLTSPTHAERTGYAHVQITLMDRVLLKSTHVTTWHRTQESLIVAARIDPSFTGEAEFPNQWQGLRRNDEGKLIPVGDPTPYHAAGYYVKFTKWHAPEPMLFVEWHLIFAEPTAWFEGANLLRSKLPLVIQTKVRGMRRDLMRQ